MAVAHSSKRKWAEIATVTLLVGETRTAFHVHEAALFEASPFFKAAFNSNFRESSDRTMTLPEDDEFIFGFFVDWVYHQRYEIPPLIKDPHKGFMQAVQLYVLADRYGVRKLKNLIVSSAFSLMKDQGGILNSSTIAYAYEHTPHDSSIRKIFADMMSTIDSDWYQEADSQDWLRSHPKICTDVVVRLAKRRQADEDPFDGEMPEEYIEKEQESEE